MSEHHAVTKVHRVVLAMLDGNRETAEFALEQIGDCRHCLRQALRYAVELLAAEMSHDDGQYDDAVDWLKQTILTNRDARDGKQTG